MCQWVLPTSSVWYPAAVNSEPSQSRRSRSSRQLPAYSGCPFSWARRPVTSVVRAGTQTGQSAKQLVKRVPW